MPLVDIELIEGVFDEEQKARMIEKVTNAIVEIEGEGMRGVTWVRVKEVCSGQWGIWGKTAIAADIKAMAAAERGFGRAARRCGRAIRHLPQHAED